MTAYKPTKHIPNYDRLVYSGDEKNKKKQKRKRPKITRHTICLHFLYTEKINEAVNEEDRVA